jgi:Na+/proline symporter
MTLVDWAIVVGYALLILGIGVAFARRAQGGIEDYFLSGRKLPWWLAGTSMVATSFSADTPLLVTRLVRSDGVAGNWHWWFLALASVASVFFFARLWRRARVVSDMEFIELRYGPGPGAILRGVKAIFFGVVFNVYAMGAWPILGLSKVVEETTDWSRIGAVLFCCSIGLTYAIVAGLWGVVATEFLQFIWAMGGSIMLAGFAIDALGGWGVFWDRVESLPQGAFVPPHTPEDFWASPWVFFLSLVLVQWWARGVEGDGMAVQRLSACKDERHSFFAMLWFNIAHYAIRPWPWIVVALASLVLLPHVTDPSGALDHERAYPRMALLVLPEGCKGFLIAAFFAAFMSTVNGHLNWGASYVVNDVYRRFVRPEAPPRHYVRVGRIATFFLMVGGAVIGLTTSSIVEAFYNVLLLFSGIGLVGIARWFWWRVNAWSEIGAMIGSGALTLLASPIARGLDLPDAPPIRLGIVVSGSTALWLTVTLLTRPTPREHLERFYERVRPAGAGWRPIAALHPEVRSPDSLLSNLAGWATGVVFVLGATLCIGKLVLGRFEDALAAAAAAGVSGVVVVRVISRMRWGGID